MDDIRPRLTENHNDRISVAFSVTRPSNTTQYAANDVWAASTSSAYAIALDGIGEKNGQYVDIVGARIMASVAATTAPDVTIFVFSAPPASPVDNAAFTVTDAEMATCIAEIGFGTWKKSALNARSQMASGSRIPAKLGATTTSAYMLIVVNNAYTCVAEEILSGSIMVERHRKY